MVAGVRCGAARVAATARGGASRSRRSSSTSCTSGRSRPRGRSTRRRRGCPTSWSSASPASSCMPVQPFPGERNWGYDGVAPYAVHEAYGGPPALQRFVDRAHALGLAVCLDVVYNHLGPEGNYLAELGPYFTDRHRSLWGDGLDYDGVAAGAGARVHDRRGGAVDPRLPRGRAAPRRDARDPGRLARPPRRGAGRGSPRRGPRRRARGPRRRGERRERPQGARSAAARLGCVRGLGRRPPPRAARARSPASGRPSSPTSAARRTWRARSRRGSSTRASGPRSGSGRTAPTCVGLAPSRFVTCVQNHDQVGNRPQRRAALRARALRRALAPLSALVVLGSGMPLLFMGEEYGEDRPFLYFTSHTDPALAKAVSRGAQERVHRRRRRGRAGPAGRADVPSPRSSRTAATGGTARYESTTGACSGCGRRTAPRSRGRGRASSARARCSRSSAQGSW